MKDEKAKAPEGVGDIPKQQPAPSLYINPAISGKDAETGKPLQCFFIPSPLVLLQIIAPELVPHYWQAEELARLGGFQDLSAHVENPFDTSAQQLPNREAPLRYLLSAANSSGKDQFIISAFTVWFILTGLYNRVIITSSSFKQIKGQTEPGIVYLIRKANLIFGPETFRSVELHHRCNTTGGEIVLFATDDPQIAEGYHPWPGGQMALITNEAKGVSDEIYRAQARCEGYSYWLEVSSPGPKSGSFYNHAKSADIYPAQAVFGKYWLRYISAYDCPHIGRTYIENFIAEHPAWLVASSIYGQFADIDEDTVIIPGHFLEDCRANGPKPIAGDIGIGLDVALGGDMNSCYVRSGNHIIHSFHFRQKDIDITTEYIDRELLPWKSGSYLFSIDDGGNLSPIGDKLAKLGWRLNRVTNQSPAKNKRKFINRGIENFWHLRTLIVRKEIVLPNDPKLLEQLPSRRYDGAKSATGRLQIEDKKEHRQRTGESPDRADAYVLAHLGFKSQFFAPAEQKAARPAFSRSFESFVEAYTWGRIAPKQSKQNGKSIIQQFHGI